MAITDNLVSYWKLDEASGNALDAHGSNNLTDNNTVGAATGKVSGARDFESSSTQYFSHGSNSDFVCGDIDVTWACWVQLESKTSDMVVFAKLDRAEAFPYVCKYVSSSDRFVFTANTGGATTVTANNFGSPSTVTWYYIVVWHDSVANTINIRVNNGTADSASFSAGLNDTFQSSTPFGIGAQFIFQSGEVTWDGLIDEFGFWKGRCLSGAELTTLYNGGAGLAYPFSAGSGTTITVYRSLLGVGV